MISWQVVSNNLIQFGQCSILVIHIDFHKCVWRKLFGPQSDRWVPPVWNDKDRTPNCNFWGRVVASKNVNARSIGTIVWRSPINSRSTWYSDRLACIVTWTTSCSNDHCRELSVVSCDAVRKVQILWSSGGSSLVLISRSICVAQNFDFQTSFFRLEMRDFQVAHEVEIQVWIRPKNKLLTSTTNI
jgi:hypothetical protein